jgi:hypothetical protein
MRTARSALESVKDHRSHLSHSPPSLVTCFDVPPRLPHTASGINEPPRFLVETAGASNLPRAALQLVERSMRSSPSGGILHPGGPAFEPRSWQARSSSSFRVESISQRAVSQLDRPRGRERRRAAMCGLEVVHPVCMSCNPRAPPFGC